MFAEYATAPSQSAVKIPDSLDLEQAALTEPASCCLSGAEMMRIDDGKNGIGVVIGGGIMGLFTLACLKRRGVERMVMSEPVAARREMARQFGADLLHDPVEGDLGDFMKDHNGGYGANIAAEVVGRPELVAKCVEVVRPRGQVLIIGVAPEGAPLPVDLYDMHYREITVKGAFGRGDVFARTPAEIDTLDLSGVISGRYELQDVPQAIVDSGEGKGVKFVIKPHN
jgi:threonine dehydrogenase-like Zn-dependent dehydrogenase